MFSSHSVRNWRAALALGLGAAGLAGAAGCGAGASERTGERAGTAAAAAPAGGIDAVDDVGRPVHLATPARRVISLIPSATETLVALGAADRVVGRTRYDVAPEVASVPSVGGGLDPSVEAIVALHPDLVVGWANDKRQAALQKLASLRVPVFALKTDDTVDVFRNVATLGRLTGRDSAARAVAAGIRRDFDAVRQSVAGRPRPRVFYVVFNDPPMTAGPNTFIAQLIGVAGAQSVFPDVKQPWPTVSMEEIVRRDPDLVVVPRGERSRGEAPGTALAELRTKGGWRDVGAVKRGRVVTVDENLVNRPGPHLGEAARALRAVFHPELGSAGR